MSESVLRRHSRSTVNSALLISAADQPPRRVELDRERLTLGRDESCDIPLSGTTISRRHAEIFSDPFGRWWVRDLGSRNGVYLDGQRVAERALRAGDMLRIGEFAVALEQPESKRSKSAPGSTLFVSRDDDVLVSLQEMEPPKIAAEHLSTLISFGREQLNVEEETDRRERLCRLLLRPEFGAQYALMIAVDGGEPDTLAGPFFASQHMPEPHLSRRCLDAVRKTGRPTLASTQVTGPDVLKMSIIAGPASQAASAAACPLSFGEESRILYVGLPPERANNEWLAIISLAAEQFRSAEAAWLARHQAVLHASIEQELEQATLIQRRLVPREVKIAGVEVAIAFHPCRWVAGDYVGARQLADGRVLLAVADVCGKGMPAALVASSVHTMLFASVRTGAELCEMMTAINSYLCETLGLNRFVTMICCLFDPATGKIEYANAGHPPAIVLKSGKSPRELGHSHSLPLGITDESCICMTDQLDTDEVLALYTDGLSELSDGSGKMLGIDGVAALMSEELNLNAATPLQLLAQSIEARLDTARDGMMAQDDMTLLLVRRQ